MSKQTHFGQPEVNKYTFEHNNACLNSTGEIECSEKNSKPMRTSKKQKMQARISTLLKANSSLKSMLKEPSPGPLQKIPSMTALSLSSSSSSQRRPISVPLITNNLQEKYSRSLFSPFSTANTQLGQQHFDSPVSVTSYNESVTSRQYIESLQNAQIDLNLEEQLTNEWSNLNQQLPPVRDMHESRMDNLDLQIQPIQRCISREKLSSHSSFSEVSLQNSDSDSNVRANDICDVKEQLTAQNVHQHYLAEQNRNISMQIQKFEWYVRDKIEQTEAYMKQKLSQFEDSNGIIIDALNDIKHMEREQPVRINGNGPGKLVGFTMPKIPISKQVSLVILNNALKNTQYMEQFVSEVSRVVTLYVYNPKKSVKSVMTKMFTLNLLIKYSWSASSSKRGLPEFSSLTGVLRAISRLLTNYMSDRDMRREIKQFFKEIPRIYEQQKIRYF